LIDPAYPAALARTADPPATLFLRGSGTFAARAAAIVGTRTPSDAARDAAGMLAIRLAERGWQIISGLAIGVDTAAHLGALAVPAGSTIAVLGGGVLNVYPPGNRSLAQAVSLRGLLVSETHPQADVSPSALVARNRIITGLASVVIVVETSSEGGAMHAARRALDQGRTVLTVDPAFLTGRASGNQALIDAGVRSIAPDDADLAALLPLI
ncbi:MAG: DNA-protecting protein DprA, partial [Anaerolinea sp.]|nr:DNA-protecting protein DprA [Anaerolinea sp.]